jgi:DNA-binding GntR family transcriptional regulator
MDEFSMPFEQSTLSDRVYNAILEQLMNQKIRPGEKLNVEILSSMLGVSRTPVREALHRLSLDGLVDFSPRYGMSAKEITPQDITDLYDLRRCLEIHAARSAIGKIPIDRAKGIDDLIETCYKASGMDFVNAQCKLDQELHKVIRTFCRNKLLKVVLEKISPLNTFIQKFHFSNDEWAELALANLIEHENIWKAIKNGDEKLTARYLDEHFEYSERRVLEGFDQQNSDREHPRENIEYESKILL